MERSPQKPDFIEGMLASAIPVAVTLVVAAIVGFLIYLFWFGAGWLFR